MKHKFGYLTILMLLIALGCNVKESNDTGKNLLLLGLVIAEQERVSGMECTTNVDNSKTFDINSPIELCKPKNGEGRHFRFENVGTSTNNAYLNLLIGYGKRENSSEFPTTIGMGGSAATTIADDGRWRIYFGKSVSCDKALIDVRFSGTNSGNVTYHEILTTQALSTTSAPPCSTTNPSGVWGPSTICMDVTRGKEAFSPKIRVWVTGKNGADCKNLSTLRANNTVYAKEDWNSKVQTRSAFNYIYRNLDSISLEKVVVRSESVLGE
ncbi:MAG: hypothetical protein N3A69_00365 [Leptospiraceae bacterium]|nr:hypothetical protein [Leptospiraceae bacterium]